MYIIRRNYSVNNFDALAAGNFFIAPVWKYQALFSVKPCDVLDARLFSVYEDTVGCKNLKALEPLRQTRLTRVRNLCYFGE